MRASRSSWQLARRPFLQTAGAATAAVAISQGSTAANEPPTIIDTHTHFYDPTRPGGVPWPGKTDSVLYRTVLPKHFREVAAPHGVTGTIVVEASPLLEDNQWLLDLAKDEPLIVGIVGRLAPGDKDFATNLARFAKNPQFRGIRVNQADLTNGLESTEFVVDLQRLAAAGLMLDVNGGPDVIPLVARTAEKLPELRIVLNHCGNLRIDGQPPPADWLAAIKAASAHKNVWCKVSALVEGAGRGGNKAPAKLAFYRPVLDALWAAFGEDRLVYGSNWPVSGRFASYGQVFDIVAGYFRGKGDEVAGKFFAKNSQAAYQWRKREA